MDTKLPEKLNIDAYEMRITDIAEVDPDQLQALSMSVGWPHRRQDWLHVLELGRGFAALDEIGRVSASAMWFEHEDGFATFGMLMTSPKLQSNGAARWLAERIRSECSAGRMRLNATRDARRLSEALGFKSQSTVYQCQGIARTAHMVDAPNTGLTLRSMEHADLDAVVALDTPAFSSNRRHHLFRLFKDSIGYCLFDGGKLRAYSMCRRFGRGHVIGPVIAHTDDEAIAVVMPHLTAYSESFVRLDTHFSTGAFATLVQTAGLGIYDTVTTMISCDDAAYSLNGDGKACVYALASQTLG